MNSRQRRGVILLLLSIVCALGAFVGVLSVISDVKSKVGPEVTAYRLKSDVPPYTTLSTGQFEKIEMPERWLSDNAVTDLREIQGKIAVTTLEAGSLLQSDMIVRQPALQPGQQEVAIMIDAATGVAGKNHARCLGQRLRHLRGRTRGRPRPVEDHRHQRQGPRRRRPHPPRTRRVQPHPAAHRRRPDHVRTVRPRRAAHHLRRVVRQAGPARPRRARQRHHRPRAGPDVRTRERQVRGCHAHEDPPGSR